MSESNRLARHLAENPRLLGVLFMTGLLLTQAGTAFGSDGLVVIGGP